MEDAWDRLVNCGMQRDIARWLCDHLPPEELEVLVEQTEEDCELWMS